MSEIAIDFRTMRHVLTAYMTSAQVAIPLLLGIVQKYIVQCPQVISLETFILGLNGDYAGTIWKLYGDHLGTT